MSGVERRKEGGVSGVCLRRLSFVEERYGVELGPKTLQPPVSIFDCL